MSERTKELKRLDRELDKVTYDIIKSNDTYYIRKQKIDDLDKTFFISFEHEIAKLIKKFFLDMDTILAQVYKMNREDYTTFAKRLKSYNDVLTYIYKNNDKILKNTKNIEDYIVDVNNYIDRFYSINIPVYKRLVEESKGNLLKVPVFNR